MYIYIYVCVYDIYVYVYRLTHDPLASVHVLRFSTVVHMRLCVLPVPPSHDTGISRHVGKMLFVGVWVCVCMCVCLCVYVCVCCVCVCLCGGV